MNPGSTASAVAASPLVSVVLPTYNRVQTLGRAMHSVLGQTYTHLELIVVDDGSTDGTAELVASISDARIRYLRLEQNQGVSNARNLGAEQARGRLLAFQDSDDEWRVDKLRLQVEALSSQPDVALVLCGNLFLNAWPMSFLGVDSQAAVVDCTRMVRFRIPGAPCWLLPRAEFLKEQGFDLGLDCFEDWELALRLSQRGRVLLVNEPLLLVERQEQGLFSREEGYARNLVHILSKHENLLRPEHQAWASYCNLIGQGLSAHRSTREGRAWFWKAIRSHPRSPRSWLNLLVSCCGSGVFAGYVRCMRWLRARLAAPTRPSLH